MGELSCTDGVLLTRSILVLLDEILGHAVALSLGLEDSQLGTSFFQPAVDVVRGPRSCNVEQSSDENITGLLSTLSPDDPVLMIYCRITISSTSISHALTRVSTALVPGVLSTDFLPGLSYILCQAQSQPERIEL